MAATYEVPGSFATINAALAAIPADLSGEGLQEVIISAGTFLEDVPITGFTNSSASDFIRIRAKTGDEHGGIFGTGVIVDGNSGVQPVFDIRESFTEIIDIEAHGTGDSQEPFSTFGNSESKFIRCLADGKGNDGQGIQLQSSFASAINCAAKNCRNGFTGQFASAFYNCVAYNNDINGFVDIGGVFDIFNCVSFGNTSADFSVTATSASNNVSEDGSAPGTNSLINQTISSMKFVNVGTDFHVEQGSILQAVGIEQSSVFTTDIDGQIIDLQQWPVGYDYLQLPTCWKYAAPYKGSNRLWTANGPDEFPASLKVPKNVDISRGVMIDEGQLIDPSRFNIEQ